MTEPDGSDRPTVRNVNMTHDELEAVARHIASIVGPAAYKLRKAPTLTSGPEVRPEYRSKVIFPHVGLSNANTVAKRFKAFAGTLAPESRDRLRFITLRLGPKPEAGQLESALKALSAAVNTFIEHLQGSGRVQPLLSTVHVRFDVTCGRLDPHYQAIVDIRDRHVKPVMDYLLQRFAGAWMDSEPVRNPKGAAFYLCAGIFDYSAMLDWPEDLLLEAYNLPRYRFIRPAGDFASFGQVKAQAIPKTETQAASVMPDASMDALERRGALVPLSGVKDRTSAEEAATDQISRLLAVIDRTGPGPLDSSYTVRPLPPESESWPRRLRDGASLEEIEFTLEVLGGRLGFRYDEGRGILPRAKASFEEICRQRDITLADGLVAVALTEAMLGYELFVRGSRWTPYQCQQTLEVLGPMLTRILHRGASR